MGEIASIEIPLVGRGRVMSEEQYGRLTEDAIGLYLEGEITWGECRAQLRKLSERYDNQKG